MVVELIAGAIPLLGGWYLLTKYQKERIVYAYPGARVSVMKLRLFKQRDFNTMISDMNIPGIIGFLEASSDYKKDMVDSSRDYRGAELIEMATVKNLIHTVEHIKKIAGPRPNDLLRVFLNRWDVINLQTIFRAKQTGTSTKEIIHSMVPLGDLSAGKLQMLAECEGIS